jgi:hypothetical protein
MHTGELLLAAPEAKRGKKGSMAKSTDANAAEPVDIEMM